MKRNVIVMVLMMMSTLIFAQRRHLDPKAMADKRSDRMKKELLLNDDQYSKVKVINEKFAENNVKLRRDTSLTVGTLRHQMKTMRTEHENQLKGVLTADQWTKWTALKSKKMEERKKGRHNKTDNG